MCNEFRFGEASFGALSVCSDGLPLIGVSGLELPLLLILSLCLLSLLLLLDFSLVCLVGPDDGPSCTLDVLGSPEVPS